MILSECFLAMLPILGTAKAAHADLLVTVDKDLLAFGQFGKSAVIRPGEFWRRGWSSSTGSLLSSKGERAECERGGEVPRQFPSPG